VPVWPVAHGSRDVVEPLLKIEPSIDRGLTHRALCSLVRAKWLALLDAKRLQHPRHHLVVLSNRFDAHNRVHVFKMTFVVERQRRITVI
jgi:hypothetical protein